MVQNKGLEARYERYREIIKNLTLMSDMFMRNVFKQKECLEYVLQVIMKKQELQVIDQVIQKDYKNLQGRSAILDCVAKDEEGRQFDVEIQQDNEGASPRRARYHSGLMDMNTLNAGQDFDELPETYVIFITRDDTLGSGYPIYHINRTVQETCESFQDGTHIIYVNSKKQEDTELGKLMHDLHCKDPEEMYSKILAKRVSELKETPEGVEEMCREMEEIYYEGMEIGEERGRRCGIEIGERRGEERGRMRGIEIGEKKVKKETAVSMAEEGMQVERIAKFLKVNVEEVQKWLDAGLCTK